MGEVYLIFRMCYVHACCINEGGMEKERKKISVAKGSLTTSHRPSSAQQVSKLKTINLPKPPLSSFYC